MAAFMGLFFFLFVTGNARARQEQRVRGRGRPVGRTDDFGPCDGSDWTAEILFSTASSRFYK